MPMEYLQGLARDELPLIESDVTNIDKLRVLRAACCGHGRGATAAGGCAAAPGAGAVHHGSGAGHPACRWLAFFGAAPSTAV